LDAKGRIIATRVMVGISIAVAVGKGVLMTVPHELRRLASIIRRISRMLESRNWYQDVGATHASLLLSRGNGIGIWASNTYVTQGRKQLFGHIVEEEMVLNGVGKMVEEVWIAIPKHFPNVELGAFVIMPNHIHGIISITVGAWHAVPAQEVADVGATHPARGGFALRRPYRGYPKVLRPHETCRIVT